MILPACFGAHSPLKIVVAMRSYGKGLSELGISERCIFLRVSRSDSISDHQPPSRICILNVRLFSKRSFRLQFYNDISKLTALPNSDARVLLGFRRSTSETQR
jgi:hypothetical protein